jgi:hypothetical protein
MIKSGVERGEIRKNIDAESQAAIFISALRGVMTQWLLDPDHVDIEAIKKELIDNVRRTLSV